MSYKTVGSSIFASAVNSLKSSYYYLSQGTEGLTMDNLLNPKVDSKYCSYNNYRFSSYLMNNFSKLDTNADGIISNDEVEMYSNKITTSGLTYNELAELYSQGNASSLLETVLENFYDVDANGDGKITSSEIAAYQIDKDREEVEEKYPKIDPNKMSVFYDTTSSTTTDKTSSK